MLQINACRSGDVWRSTTQWRLPISKSSLKSAPCSENIRRTNKTILITGTSTGLGRATAKLFLAKGWNVVATMRRPDEETEFTRFDNTLVARLDVEDEKSIQLAVDAGLAKFCVSTCS